MTKTLKIATRQSPMALWQAESIKTQLQNHHPDLEISLVPMTTSGDDNTETSLTNVGGKSLFVKTLQKALLLKKADIAVHCIKDMSVQDTPGLTLACICKRDDPRDVLVSNHYNTVDALPAGSIIGTASPRRQCLLLSQYPQLNTALLRGNVNTRLQKLDDGEYDAIILAAAGLHRLGFESRITEYLDTASFVPAIAQGALGIECRLEDTETMALLTPLHDTDTATCITAERHVNQILGGSCFTPIGAFATLHPNVLTLAAAIGSTDGSKLVRVSAESADKNAVALAEYVANDMLAKGAKSFLR